MGSDGGASLKRMTDAGVVGQLALENVHISLWRDRGQGSVANQAIDLAPL